MTKSELAQEYGITVKSLRLWVIEYCSSKFAKFKYSEYKKRRMLPKIIVSNLKSHFG